MTRPLWQIAAIRILIFGMLAALAQMIVVISDYYFNDEELGRLLIERQVDMLSEGLTVTPDRMTYVPPDAARALFAERSGYYARVRTPDGTVLFTSCDEVCEDHFLPRTVRQPDFWVRFIAPGKPLSVAGGGTVERDGRALVIEFATIGDAKGLIWGVFFHEALDHLVVPMSILLIFVIGGTIVSIIAALRPVTAAAEAADNLNPLELGDGLPTENMPEEVRHLTRAVNGAFSRMGDLIRGQRTLTSAIAHEVRTPLAIIKLELSGIDHPRARKAEADVDELSEFVSQLTALARLEAIRSDQFEPVDLGELCEDVVASIAPWVLARQDVIGFENKGGGRVRMVPSLIKDACRNLIENAVRHSPPGTAISVEAGPGPEIRIIDSKPASTVVHPHRLPDSLGIGLTIVERVLSLHGATLDKAVTETGMGLTLRFEPAD